LDKSISFAQYSPHEDGRDLTKRIVACYREVFADGPWHEWKRCPKCKKYWGRKDHALLHSQDFRHCDTALVDFWSEDQVTSDLFHEITDKASCWLALCDQEVIGFCWGYPITVDDLEKKLGIKLNLPPNKLFAYQAEVGVLAEYRGKGIAKRMVRHRLSDFLSQGLDVGVVRTRQYPEPSQTFSWYQKAGYTVQSQYPDDDGRVIMIRSLDGLDGLL
jgi:ribosomal protein S18 acetylase RimI-like enzyme